MTTSQSVFEELYAKHKQPTVANWFVKDADGNYVNHATASAWLGWQLARAVTPAKPQPSTGNALEGQMDGVKFYGRRMFPLDPNSPWVVQSLTARGEGATHVDAVLNWQANYHAKQPDISYAVGQLMNRPVHKPGPKIWMWHIHVGNGVWLVANGARVSATYYAELAKVLGSVDGMVKLPDWRSFPSPQEQASRDSLQP